MFALGHRHSPATKLIFEFLQLNRRATQEPVVREAFPLWKEAKIVVTKNFITLLYIIVGLPGWPNGAGGGLQTRYNVGSIPTPGSKI